MGQVSPQGAVTRPIRVRLLLRLIGCRGELDQDTRLTSFRAPSVSKYVARACSKSRLSSGIVIVSLSMFFITTSIAILSAVHNAVTHFLFRLRRGRRTIRH